jgi:hypothetical protein
MDILNKIAAALAAFAAAAVTIAKDEGVELAGKIAADVTDALEDAVDKLGAKATEIVTALFADDSLSGIEKANLAATQLVEHATTTGIQVAAHDVTTLIKSAYLAVKDEIAKL